CRHGDVLASGNRWMVNKACALQFERADVAAVAPRCVRNGSNIAGTSHATLISGQPETIALIDSDAGRYQRMGWRRPAVVGQWRQVHLRVGDSELVAGRRHGSSASLHDFDDVITLSCKETLDVERIEISALRVIADNQSIAHCCHTLVAKSLTRRP